MLMSSRSSWFEWGGRAVHGVHGDSPCGPSSSWPPGRGKRARTWITGVLAFLASIVEAFTGYLSQQNFNSRWIATNGKDAFNAVGVGGFWQMMSFGQILLWHIVLMPLILLALVGLHL